MALGTLLLLLAVAAGVLIATFDANRYKSLAVDWMQTTHQRTLALDGPVELSIFPRLAVKVSKLRLSEHGRSDEFMRLDEVALAVRVMPLLRHQLVIDKISARGVRAAYLRDNQGRRNIDDLLNSERQPDTDSSPALRFDVSAVRFDDLQLRVRDDLSQVAGELALQSFSSGRLARQTQTPLTLRATIELTQPQPLRLSLDGKTTLALDLDRGGVALSNMRLDVQGDAAGLKALALQLEGALAWDGNTLSAGPLRLAAQSATLNATQLSPSTLNVKKLVFNPSGKKLEIESLALALAGQQGARPFALALDWPQLAVDDQQLRGSALSGRYEFSGGTSLAGKFVSGAPSGNFDTLRLPNVAFGVAGRAGPRQMDGSVKADLLLGLGEKTLALERLDLATRLTEPGLQALQLALRGTAHASAQSVTWRVEGALNTNRFESQGSAAFAGATPRIQASARFDKLDLNRLLAPEQTAASAAATTAPASDTALPLQGLRAVNGQFALAAGALAFRQYKVVDARLDATLNEGSLRVAQLTGRAWGGRIDASGSADARSQGITIKLAADSVDVNALLKDVAGKDLLAGRGRVSAELRTGGTSLSAWRSNLSGTAALNLRDGAIKGVNLARSLRQAKAALTLRQDAVAQARETEKTDFSELRASARIAEGVAHSDDLDAKSPFLRLGGAGTFDVGRGRIDYTARATVVAAPAGQDGAELAALRGVTVPVLLSGPFDAIDWKIQWSRIAGAAIENKLKAKLTEQIGARLGVAPAASAASGAASTPVTPREQLKDALKGLFR